jgi:hypothetical protein
MHQILNDLGRGQTVSLRFGSEAEVHHVLEVLNEVATSRQLAIEVRATGSRTLELSLAHKPA